MGTKSKPQSGFWAVFSVLGTHWMVCSAEGCMTPLRCHQGYPGCHVERTLWGSKTQSKEASWETMGIIHSVMDTWAEETSGEALKSFWPAPKCRALGWLSLSISDAIWLLPPLPAHLPLETCQDVSRTEAAHQGAALIVICQECWEASWLHS